jgi:hypothetical protein
MSKPALSRVAAAVVMTGVLSGLPFAAGAQVYKCAQPDGSTTFQQSPCLGVLKAPAAAPADANKGAPSKAEPYYDPYAPENVRQRASAVTLPVVRPNQQVAAPAERQPTPAETRASADAARQRAANTAEQQRIAAENEKTRAENEQTRAYNKQVRCNSAKHDVDVLQMQRPVYRLDNKGQQQFIDDKDRSRELQAAQQRMNAECQ